MRKRSLAIGQRHRTVLFLVDGRRSLDEVLHLAEQAGALSGHFEELVRLGLVELAHEAVASAPVPLSATSPADAVVTDAAPADAWPRAEPVAPSLPATPSAITTAPAPAPPVRGDAIGAPSTPTIAVPEARAASTRPQPIEAADAGSRRMPLAPPPAPTLQPPASASARGRRRVATTRQAADLPVLTTSVAGASGVADAEALPRTTPGALSSPVSPVDPGDQRLLARVRELLIATLRLDAPLFGAQMLVLTRRAKSIDDLVELVWKIEKHLARSSHSREDLINLDRARELLNLGNTKVLDDAALRRMDAPP